MKTRKLGRSDLQITPLGLGAWAMGGAGWEFGWGAQDDRASEAAIHRALEMGINWIDTAAAYGLGHSEEIIARALAHWSGPRPYVFTKCGLRWNHLGQVHRTIKANSIRLECEASLRRLQVETIDLYQIHWPTGAQSEIEEGWQAMAQLKQEGKVRWIGVSNFNAEQLAQAQRIAPVTSLQPPYSLIRREVERDTLPYCLSQETGVIVYSPMASGLLSGAMTRERIAALPADDWRSRNAEFQEPKLSAHLSLVERLRVIGDRHGYSPGQVAIAWALHHPAVTGAIVGARSATQVKEIIGASALHLSSLEIAEIEAKSYAHAETIAA